MNNSFVLKLASRSKVDHIINNGASIKGLHAALSAELEYASVLLYKDNLSNILSQLIANDALAADINQIDLSSISDSNAFQAHTLIEMVNSNKSIASGVLRDKEVFGAADIFDGTPYEDCDYDSLLQEYNSRLLRLDCIRKSHTFNQQKQEARTINNADLTGYVTHDLIVVKLHATGNIHAIGSTSYVVLKPESRINFLVLQEDSPFNMVMYVTYSHGSASKLNSSPYAAIIYTQDINTTLLIPFNNLELNKHRIKFVCADIDGIFAIKRETHIDNFGRNHGSKESFIGNCEMLPLAMYTSMHDFMSLETVLPADQAFSNLMNLVCSNN